MKVLIVDDNETNLKLLRAVLESENFEVVEAVDGMQALQLLGDHQPGAIISDILMPKMDGYRFCAEVRKTERFRHLPFIFYTSTYTTPADQQLAFTVGGDVYLKKPASASAIIQALRETTRLASQRPRRLAVLPEGLKLVNEYSSALVRKLEQKNAQLEAAQTELRRINTQLEERVEERTLELERANVELQAFNHSVAHDLRNPLTGIMSSAQCLQLKYSESLDADGRELLHYINVSGTHMAGIITDLLKLSEVAHSQLQKEACDLSALALEIAARLQRANPEHRVNLTIEPGIAATGDRHLLMPALENLLGNAWKYTGKTRDPQVQFGWEWKEGRAIYFVRDNGIGFEMSKAGDLFKPFRRLHPSSQFPGTGIGLTIAQRAIERHGGQIWAESKPDRGTTFFFRL
jgi:signal transduction histidine kinase